MLRALDNYPCLEVSDVRRRIDIPGTDDGACRPGGDQPRGPATGVEVAVEMISGKLIRTVAVYEKPPNDFVGAVGSLGWSMAKAFEWLGFRALDSLLADGIIAPDDWAPWVEKLEAERQRQCNELGPLLVVGGWATQDLAMEALMAEEGEVYRCWSVMLFRDVEPAAVSHWVGGDRWSIEDVGGCSAMACMVDVRALVEADGLNEDALWEPSMWHPALRAEAAWLQHRRR